jgi:hypothetical protein
MDPRASGARIASGRLGRRDRYRGDRLVLHVHHGARGAEPERRRWGHFMTWSRLPTRSLGRGPALRFLAGARPWQAYRMRQPKAST